MVYNSYTTVENCLVLLLLHFPHDTFFVTDQNNQFCLACFTTCQCLNDIYVGVTCDQWWQKKAITFPKVKKVHLCWCTINTIALIHSQCHTCMCIKCICNVLLGAHNMHIYTIHAPHSLFWLTSTISWGEWVLGFPCTDFLYAMMS